MRRCRHLLLCWPACALKLQLCRCCACMYPHGRCSSPACLHTTATTHFGCIRCYLPSCLQRDNFEFFITMGMGLGNRLGGWVLRPCCSTVCSSGL